MPSFRTGRGAYLDELLSFHVERFRSSAVACPAADALDRREVRYGCVVRALRTSGSADSVLNKCEATPIFIAQLSSLMVLSLNIFMA